MHKPKTYYICLEIRRQGHPLIVREASWARQDTRRYGPFTKYGQAQRVCNRLRMESTQTLDHEVLLRVA